MSIAQYLNLQGTFLFVELPTFQLSGRLARGTFPLVPHKWRHRMWKIRSDCYRLLRCTTLPVGIVDVLHYLPEGNRRAFQNSALRIHKRTKRFLTEVKSQWRKLTAAGREEVEDMLTLRWSGGPAKQSVSQARYLRESLSDFDKYVANGPNPKYFTYSYCSFDGSTTKKPQHHCCLKFNVLLWKWLMSCDTRLQEILRADLDYLVGRAQLYRAMDNKTYTRRNCVRDVRDAAFTEYAASLRVLGRSEAAKIVQKFADKLQAFHLKYKGKNRVDGSSTSRLPAARLFEIVPNVISDLLDALDAPLNIDALAG